MSNKSFGIALLGCGTLGQGVYALLTDNAERIRANYGVTFEVHAILVRDVNKPRGSKFNAPEADPAAGPKYFQSAEFKKLLTTDFNQILYNADVDVIVEMMGGEGPKDFMMDAFRCGKAVITSNKVVVASWGDRLVERARQHDRYFGYSAAASGFHQFCQSIITSVLTTEMVGILNGTTNFILSNLHEKTSRELLDLAIRNRFTESDPQDDTSGFDTRNKLTIATRLSFGIHIDHEEVHTQGIDGIDHIDVAFAKKLQMTIKLLGVSRISDGKVTSVVAPCLISENDRLATVDGVRVGIVLRDEFQGVLDMSAVGSGQSANAQAVFSDLISMARNDSHFEGTVWPDAGENRRSLKFSKVIPAAEYYFRVVIPDSVGGLSDMLRCFVRNGININQVLSGEPRGGGIPVAFICGRTRLRAIQNVAKEAIDLNLTIHPPIVLRLEASPNEKKESATKTEEVPYKVEVKTHYDI